MPPQLSFLGPARTLTQGSTELEADPAVDLLEELLKKLEFAQPEPPKKVGKFRSALGSIGDAISAKGAVLAGGQAPRVGAFAGTQQRKQLAFETQTAMIKAKGAELRNQVRIKAFEAGMKTKAGTKLQFKTIQTVDENGLPITATFLFDPDTGKLTPMEQNFEKAEAPVILPGVPGVNPPIRVSRRGPIGPIKGAVTPPPPSSTAKEAGTALSMKVLLKKARKDFTAYVETSTRGKRTVTSLGRNIPLIGGPLEEVIISYTDPEGVNVARQIDNLADILLRLRSGAQINDREFQRLRSLLPKLGENFETAIANFDRFELELNTTLRLSRNRAPSLFTQEVLSGLGLSLEGLFGIDDEQKKGKFSGRSIDESIFTTMSQADQKRFTDGGGTVEKGQ